MPRISAFYGIIVWMYWKDHNPPHIHATYQEFKYLLIYVIFQFMPVIYQAVHSGF
jgi:hypothetical protein